MRTNGLKVITERDERVMQYVDEHGYVSGIGLMKMYGNKDVRTRRKQMLMDAGYLGEMQVGLGGRQRLYYLTTAGHKYLETRGLARVSNPFYPSRFKASLLAHTDAVFMVRLVLERHPAVKDFRPERVVDYYAEETQEKVTAKRFDAEVLLDSSIGRFWAGVEVELDAKSTTAYWNAITKIDAERTDVKQVLWLCRHQAVINRIAGLVYRNQAKLRDPNKHIFTLIDGLLKNGLDQPFHFIDGRSDTL
jgi:hypothetical protein